MTTDPCFLFHRAHFLDLLVEKIPTDVAHLRKRLTGYSRLPSGDILMQFADNTTAACDILLGCDGIKSVVRRCVLEERAAQGQPELLKYIEPFFSGTIAYRALVPVDRLTRNNGGKLHPAMNDAKMVSKTYHLSIFFSYRRIWRIVLRTWAGTLTHSTMKHYSSGSTVSAHCELRYSRRGHMQRCRHDNRSGKRRTGIRGPLGL